MQNKRGQTKKVRNYNIHACVAFVTFMEIKLTIKINTRLIHNLCSLWSGRGDGTDSWKKLKSIYTLFVEAPIILNLNLTYATGRRIKFDWEKYNLQWVLRIKISYGFICIVVYVYSVYSNKKIYSIVKSIWSSK